MINDPKKELQELENQLQKLETKDEEFEAFYAELFNEFGDKPAAVEEEINLDLLTDARRRVPRPVSQDVAYADRKKAAPVKKDRSIRNLCLLISAELLGIAAVAFFWFWRFL